MAKKTDDTTTTEDTTTAPADAAPQPAVEAAPAVVAPPAPAPVLTLLAKFPSKGDGAKFHAMQAQAHLSQIGVSTQITQDGAEGEEMTSLSLVGA